MKGVDVSKAGHYKHVYLLDTPSIPVNESEAGPHTILPLEPAEALCEQIMNSIDSDILCRAFGIAEFQHFQDFISQIATKHSLFKKVTNTNETS